MKTDSKAAPPKRTRLRTQVKQDLDEFKKEYDAPSYYNMRLRFGGYGATKWGEVGVQIPNKLKPSDVEKFVMYAWNEMGLRGSEVDLPMLSFTRDVFRNQREKRKKQP